MKFLSMIVGVGLLVAAIILSFIVANNGENIIAQKQKITTEYVKQSSVALEKGDVNSAVKYAKLAISADPEGVDGFNAYNKAIEAKYQPVMQETVPAVAPATPITTPTPKESADDSAAMGC